MQQYFTNIYWQQKTFNLTLARQTEQKHIYKHEHNFWAPNFYGELSMRRVNYCINFIIFGLPKLQKIKKNAKSVKSILLDLLDQDLQRKNMHACEKSFWSLLEFTLCLSLFN